MKKIFAMTLIAVMALAIGTCALAEITIDAAKDIALNKAGLTLEQVHFTKAHRDLDDGRPEFEIEFFADGTEYDFDIDAATGEITDFETEKQTRNYGAEKVTEEEAKQIALAQVGLNADAVTFTKVKLDDEDGRTVWEVEFTQNGVEYDFDIDATTAIMVDMDVDRD